MSDRPDGPAGWSLIAESEAAASLVDALLGLDPDAEYSRSELADAAGVPLKTLHLADDVERFVDLGVLEKRADGEREPRYRVNGDSAVLEAARSFDHSVREAADGADPD